MITITLSPPEGGKLLLDGQSYDPRIPYPVGSRVQVRILPLGDYQFAGWSGDVPAGHEGDVPLEITVAAEPQQLTAQFVTGAQHAAELAFDSAFDNGNGILRYLYRRNRMLVFEPQQINGADNIWWHFKLHGITPGEFLQIWPLHCSLGDEENIVWAGDCHPVYSYDGLTWQRFAGMRPPYVQRFTASSVEIARNIPYPYGKTLALAKQMDGRHVRALNLAISAEGRAVKTFRFSDPEVPDAHKRVVWVMARQHAFESHASWYAEGICRWLHGGHPLAVDLRRRAIVYVTPMMDVDAVYHGGSGKEQLGPDGRRADFNRCWGDASPWAAIRGAKELLLSLRQRYDIAAFIDLHDPWYPRPSYWGIAPDFADDVLPFAQTFSACLAETGSGALWKHDLRVAKEVEGGVAGHGDREPTQGMTHAEAWARKALVDRPEGHLYLTIEIAHEQDGYGHFIDTPTLHAYGEALGRALANMLF